MIYTGYAVEYLIQDQNDLSHMPININHNHVCHSLFFFLFHKHIHRYFISVSELWGVLYLLMLQPLFIDLGLSVLNELKPVTDGVVYHIRFNHS